MMVQIVIWVNGGLNGIPILQADISFSNIAIRDIVSL